MKISAGDRVRFIDQVGTGLVLEIAGDQVLIEDENGFETWYLQSELLLDRSLDPGEVRPKDREPDSQIKSTIRPNRMIVDLHFHVLVDFPKNFTAFEKLQIQLNECQKAVDRARRQGIRTLILIHGVGEGRLKEEVRSLLERMDRLRFYDASLAEFGQGATEVELF